MTHVKATTDWWVMGMVGFVCDMGSSGKVQKLAERKDAIIKARVGHTQCANYRCALVGLYLS